jgi:hypothetical protein
VERQAGGIIGARKLEIARFDFQRVEAAIAILVQPFPDGVPAKVGLTSSGQLRPSV